MRINVELSELQAFVAVAEALNFRAAAQTLFLSQSALSRRIDKLEQGLGARLLERSTRRVALTPAGQGFLDQARELLQGLAAAVAHVQDGTRQQGSRLTVACVPSLAWHLMPAVLAQFTAEWPGVRVRLIDESAPQVLQAVIDGEAAFGINFLGAQAPAVEFRRLCRERYLLAVPPGHPLARRTQVGWPDLVGERFIAVGGASGNRLLIEHAMAEAPARPVVHHEVRHVEAALALVEAGLGVAAVPQFALADRGPERVVAVPLVQPATHRTLGLILRQGAQPSPPAAALMRLVSAALRAARQGAG